MNKWSYFMLGMIFTELLELVENKYGYEVVDQLLANDQLTSQGTYTAIGSYDHSELLVLVKQLSEIVDTPVRQLVSEFGLDIFVKLIDSHPQILANIDGSFDLLSKIDSYIHVEVAKLYPAARLPQFSFTKIDENHIQLHYRSERPLASFAEGLLLGCACFFNEKFTINRIAQVTNSDSDVIFDIFRTKLEGAKIRTHGRTHE